jgi:hypothetical protein
MKYVIIDIIVRQPGDFIRLQLSGSAVRCRPSLVPGCLCFILIWKVCQSACQKGDELKEEKVV